MKRQDTEILLRKFYLSKNMKKDTKFNKRSALIALVILTFFVSFADIGFIGIIIVFSAVYFLNNYLLKQREIQNKKKEEKKNGE